MRPLRVLFLDYHGVLTDCSTESLLEPPDRRFVPASVRSSLMRLGECILVVVSNQVGVSRGDFSKAELNNAIHRFQTDLAADGLEINAFLYCPHHPSAPDPRFKRDCPWRKPNARHVLATLERLSVGASCAAFVGDSIETDIACARAAGVLPILLAPDRPLELPLDVSCVPDLGAAVDLLEARFQSLNPL